MAALLKVHFENLSTKPPVFQIPSAAIDGVRARFPEIAKTTDTSWSADLAEIDKWLPEVEVLMTSWDVIMHPKFPRMRLVEAAPKLRWVHVTVTGLDKLLPLDWLPEHVALTNSRGVQSEKGGEYATMALLMLHTRVPCFTTSQRQSEWKQIHTSLARDRTVCMVGLGNLGGIAAEKAKQLGMKVIGVRRHDTPHPAVDQLFPFTRLAEALSLADLVYVALPLTPDTRGMIGPKEFAAMQHGTGLVNVGRADVMDYDILVAKLRDGSLSCAVLDVFDPEPLPASSPLWSAPNLIMTPHVGVDDLQRYIVTTLELMFQNVPNLLAGKPLKNLVDRRLGY